jgi:hypothetical protein
LSFLRLDEQERAYAVKKIAGLKESWYVQQKNLTQALNLKLAQSNDRLARLTDAYIDRVIEKAIFEERKTALLLERKDIEEKLTQLNQDGRTVPDQVAQFLELAESAYSLYKSGFPEEKRDLLKNVTSNRHVEGKSVEFTLALPFSELAKRCEITNGSPQRDRLRTFDRLFSKLITYFKDNPAPQLRSSSELARKL